MKPTRLISLTLLAFLLCACAATVAAPAAAQSFGLPLRKSKVTLERKLPAVVQLPGTTVRLVVTGHPGSSELVQDFKSMLGAELLSDAPRLSLVGSGADSTIECDITDFQHPPPTTTTRPGAPTGKRGTAPPVTYTRVTGLMHVSFRAQSRSGHTLGSDNITAEYDQEFEESNSLVAGGINSMKNTFKRFTGREKSDQINPPTDAELRNDLLNSAVHQIAMQVVNTRETVEVLLAKDKGMEPGVKDAEAGLWSRALEAWETLPPPPKPVDEAYRLYDIGVAYEALGYAAPDIPSAIKFLDQASINYGKAIDDNPSEKYFLEPQKRIETALAHYDKLKRQQQAPAPAPTPAKHSSRRRRGQ